MKQPSIQNVIILYADIILLSICFVLVFTACSFNFSTLFVSFESVSTVRLFGVFTFSRIFKTFDACIHILTRSSVYLICKAMFSVAFFIKAHKSVLRHVVNGDDLPLLSHSFFAFQSSTILIPFTVLIKPSCAVPFEPGHQHTPTHTHTSHLLNFST